MPRYAGPPRSEAEKFWAKVNKNGPIHPILGTRCWLWTAYRRPNGYGGFGVHKALDSGRWFW